MPMIAVTCANVIRRFFSGQGIRSLYVFLRDVKLTSKQIVFRRLHVFLNALKCSNHSYPFRWLTLRALYCARIWWFISTEIARRSVVPWEGNRWVERPYVWPRCSLSFDCMMKCGKATCHFGRTHGVTSVPPWRFLPHNYRISFSLWFTVVYKAAIRRGK